MPTRCSLQVVADVPAAAIVPMAELLEVGDDVLIESGVLLSFVNSDNEMVYTCGRIAIGSGSNVLMGSMVRGGTRIGDGATVGIMSVAQGDVPDGAVVSDTDVIFSGGSGAHIIQTTLRSPHLIQTSSLLAGHMLCLLVLTLQIAFAASVLAVALLFWPLYSLADGVSWTADNVRRRSCPQCDCVGSSSILFVGCLAPCCLMHTCCCMLGRYYL